jgi:hypothetical protein
MARVLLCYEMKTIHNRHFYDDLQVEQVLNNTWSISL